MSCENNNGRVWVDFASAADTEDFLNAVAAQYDEDVLSLYNRITGEYEDEDWETFRAEHAWRYDCLPMDYNGPLFGENGEMEQPPAPERTSSFTSRCGSRATTTTRFSRDCARTTLALAR